MKFKKVIPLHGSRDFKTKKEAMAYKAFLESKGIKGVRVRHLKGQFGGVDILGVLITVVIYVASLPVINPLVNAAVAELQSTPNEYTFLSVGILHLLTFCMFAALIIGFIRKAAQPGGGAY